MLTNTPGFTADTVFRDEKFFLWIHLLPPVVVSPPDSPSDHPSDKQDGLEKGGIVLVCVDFSVCYHVAVTYHVSVCVLCFLLTMCVSDTE